MGSENINMNIADLQKFQIFGLIICYRNYSHKYIIDCRIFGRSCIRKHNFSCLADSLFLSLSSSFFTCFSRILFILCDIFFSFYYCCFIACFNSSGLFFYIPRHNACSRLLRFEYNCPAF